ncbi:MAG: NYN domain-containing protein [Eggerthellaceae bacterium]|jgi:predicted RNA-binding protein with PIN domain|nr:NYN domain-containing protein [Eggerthellaceae bacterium]
MVKARKKILIIDGYNVLRSGNRYKEVVDPDYTDDAYNQAREKLINDVASFAGREYRAIVVFDGAHNEFSRGEVETIGNVRIMFSPAGHSADKVIEKLARDARERKIETLVVTSDGSIQDTVFGGGVDRMSANDFSWEMATLQAERESEEAPQVAYKNTLGERLSPAIREKLVKLRDEV